MPIASPITGPIAQDVLLLAEYGSRAHGTHTADSDHDLLGIYLESERQTYGLQNAHTRATQLGRRSTAGDHDVTVHPLRKYVSLALKGNPTVLSLLWTPENLMYRCTTAARLLMDHRAIFVTGKVVTAHLGFATGQYKKLAQTPGQRGRGDLVAAHGYDTKAAGNLVRVVHQGIELIEHGGYTLPLPEPVRTEVRDIRAGRWSLDQVLDRAAGLVDDLRAAEQRTDLPKRPHFSRVDRLLIDVRNHAVADLVTAKEQNQ